MFVVGAGWLQIAGLEPIDSTGEVIRESVAENRGSLLACYGLWSVAITVQGVFFAALCFETYRSGHRLLALLGAIFASALTSLMFAGYVFLGALAFRAPGISPETALLLSDLFYFTLSIAGFPGAAITIALALPMFRAQGLVRVVGWIGFASSVVHIEAAVALARSGPWSPAGWGGYVAPALFIAWMFGTAFLFLHGRPLFSAPSDLHQGD